jgi:hypothetical protein
MNQVKRNIQIKNSTQNLALWTFLWVISLALATFGPLFLWSENTTWSIIAILVNTVIGAGMIWAHVKYLSVLDELQKKIQLDAMGIALGIGIVGGLSYSVMDQANVITGDAEISFLVILISIAYMIAIFVGKQRYA